jgi:DNA repair protein RadD
MIYRDYQEEMHLRFDDAWAGGEQNVLGVLPTGGGKGALIGGAAAHHDGPTCSIAHRQELVAQISYALCRFGVEHRIVAAEATVREIVRVQCEEFGRSFYNPRARHGVASVDTLVLLPESDKWLPSVTKWTIDECHHLCREGTAKGSVNKWQKAINRMPRAKGLGLTATPLRADGKGLGRHADGIMDVMIEGPEMRELIRRGYLTDYEVYCPPTDIDLSQVGHAPSGDYSPEGVRKAVHESRTIVGDVVASYAKIALGERGVTFCVDIESAMEVCAEYRRYGIPAEVLTGKTPVAIRAGILRRLRAGTLWQVVSVDVLSEGFDLPAIQVVSFVRPTDSLGLYRQQFGRVLRIMEGKTVAKVIDHVGNVIRHRPPDALRKWSLDRRERRAKGTPDDLIPMRACPQCTRPYEKHLVGCPYCGHFPEPVLRKSPEHVEGDLVLLSPETLARLRGEVDAPMKHPFNAGPEIMGALRKRHAAKTEAQRALREAMDQWGGYRLAAGEGEREQQKRFFLTFGVDVLTAQTLGAKEAASLRERVVSKYFT